MVTPTTAMIEAFHEGGWPMFPILILGLLLVIAAVRYTLAPEARHLQVVRSMASVTFLFGCLGTLLGVIHTLSAIHQLPHEMVIKISLLGFGESINNLALALLLMVFAGLFTAVGALRASDRMPADA